MGCCSSISINDAIVQMGTRNDAQMQQAILHLATVAQDDRRWPVIVEAIVKRLNTQTSVLSDTLTAWTVDVLPLPTPAVVANALKRLHRLTSPFIPSDDYDSFPTLNVHHSDRDILRNILIVYNTFAQKFDRRLLAPLLDEQIYSLLLRCLRFDNWYFAVPAIAIIEKFAIVSDSAKQYFIEHGVVHDLERLAANTHPQLKFAATWSLEKIFQYKFPHPPPRPRIHLNPHDKTGKLKLSLYYDGGLEARSDHISFESIRANICVSSKDTSGGRFYYEVELRTPGIFQIGWARRETDFASEEGAGIGDDVYSFAYDGGRQLTWHAAVSQHLPSYAMWSVGDRLGCGINVQRHAIYFTLNGTPLGYRPTHMANSGACIDEEMGRAVFEDIGDHNFYPAASVTCFQQCRFIFAESEMKWKPRHFCTLEDVPDCYLVKEESDEHEATAKLSIDESRACKICFSAEADSELRPCGHKEICFHCALRVTKCPMCRADIVERVNTARAAAIDVSTPSDK